MTTSDINSFLSNKISSTQLRQIIDADVDNYSFLINKKGSTIHLNVSGNELIILDTIKFTRLLKETLVGNLTSVHLAYICDCLTLVEDIDFENEQIKDLLFSIADPEINGGFKNEKEINEMVQNLKNTLPI